ncbi:MAG: hypothetical protein A3B89_02640 [Candidatus Buchananbacteria bacterium RIFCSPHIGHO2_02_FULL_40_13]|uniref:EF-hand domain-containing protein n=1 Tax=Candidatus Buchananbacteria bacterium RIFCSPLOWO2_01_FULL_39_33 TaxID=1797543 RepID=A0A1G1YI45_9BACT|nr:MAG: hypothetical protein A2820_02355 [Candidatus Buchananbacteria bacterium RIFCSPHIGHO2_01_FULL_40_35]OGY49908.1 MAG: hypothetical protein A3B89_02640 [Candidatus Buchananbacteria bacterium RIFCSPHIGHO2_02_FULL_40_13]OGY51951.1 MAG: hypothetical protein A3A02_01440 [Candidatus Buchananbacteria bacterium RIFCSPLOWO2_01_FULL_39_33]
MFDQKPTPLSNQTGQEPVPSLNLPQENPSPISQPPRPTGQPGPIGPPVDDIFSQTDMAAPYKVARPIQPGEATQMPVGQEEMFGGKKLSDNKALIIILSIIGLVVIGAVTWAAVSFLTSQSGGEDADLNANTAAVNNVNANANAGINAETNANAEINTNAETNVNESIMPPPDSDNDGLSDEEEKQLGTDPKNFDTDDDGLMDRVEVRIYQTDPLNKDTDGDGYEDGAEVINGYDPAKAGARLFNIP